AGDHLAFWWHKAMIKRIGGSRTRIDDVFFFFKQKTAYEIAGRRVVSSLEEFQEQDLERISKEVSHRTETALIERLKQLPGGTCEYEARADVLGKEITVHCKLTLEKNKVRIDFAGTSPQVDKG